MKCICFILFGLGFTQLISAQHIRYINEARYDAAKDQASFFQVIYQDSVVNGSILINMYDMDSTLVESGYYKSYDYHINDGITREYVNGRLSYIKSYSNDKLNGELIGYYENGAVRRHDFYKDDLLVKGNCYTRDGSDTAYFPMRIIPTFKNKNYQYVRGYIARKVRYPEEAIEKGIEGIVYVYFCVNSKDELCDIKIAYSDNALFNKESLRVIKKTARHWQAGYSEGEKAKQSFVLPIVYGLE